MNQPTYIKEVQKFIGVINYYRDMWTSRSYTLEHLTEFTYIKNKFK